MQCFPLNLSVDFIISLLRLLLFIKCVTFLSYFQLFQYFCALPYQLLLKENNPPQ